LSVVLSTPMNVIWRCEPAVTTMFRVPTLSHDKRDEKQETGSCGLADVSHPPTCRSEQVALAVISEWCVALLSVGLVPGWP